MIGAVDIGGTKIAVGAVTPAGQIVARAQFPTHAGATAAVQQIVDALRGFGMPIEGVGVGCTGPVDPLTGVVGNVDLLPGWHGLRLTEVLSSALGVPTAMENDADAAALAEFAWGERKVAKRFIYITIGTGIGAGVILNGRLYTGAGGAHPELGHHTIDASGPACYCGAEGCWEAMASGPALERWVRQQAVAGDRLPEEFTAREVCEWATQGHALARRAIERHARLIGIGVANLVTMFCPDRIALGGGLMVSAGLFLPGVRQAVSERCGLVPYQNTIIAAASLGEDTALLGAARVWQDRYQGSPEGTHVVRP